MDRNHYNEDQADAFNRVVLLDRELREIEGLEARTRRPILSMSDVIDEVSSDISLDNYPPYHIVEKSLKSAINRAMELGLGDDEYILEMKYLAFS